jgi:hypothetical protein
VLSYLTIYYWVARTQWQDFGMMTLESKCRLRKDDRIKGLKYKLETTLFKYCSSVLFLCGRLCPAKYVSDIWSASCSTWYLPSVFKIKIGEFIRGYLGCNEWVELWKNGTSSAYKLESQRMRSSRALRLTAGIVGIVSNVNLALVDPVP